MMARKPLPNSEQASNAIESHKQLTRANFVESRAREEAQFMSKVTPSSSDHFAPKSSSFEKDGRGPFRRPGRRPGVDPDHVFDYKDPQSLKYFISERGKLMPRRITGLTATQQRALAVAVKRARNLALLPFTTADNAS